VRAGGRRRPVGGHVGGRDRAAATTPDTTASGATAAEPDAGPEATPTTTAAPTGFRLVPVASGFEQPVLATAAEGDPRLFVVEQTGRIWVLRGGRRLPEPFLDVSDEIAAGGERGLLGLALAPDFVTSGRVVVNYTNREGDTRVVRYRAPGGGDVADPASAEVLLAIDQPYGNHNGGNVLYGPDGMLWVGMGDGGAGGDPEDRAQDPDELLGKLLRIDPSRAAAGRPYAIPADNPYADGGGAPEIWATRPPQPLALQLRRRDGGPLDRRRRPGVARGGEPRRRPWRACLQLRLGHLRGHRAVHRRP
jgi:glucose/arabinose dehydrogenase